MTDKTGITTFAPKPNGVRLRSFDADNCRIHIEPDITSGADVDDDARGQLVAERLHRYMTCAPEPLLDTAYVRLDESTGRLWLLGGRERGWGAFGVPCAGWDDLFRRFAVVIVAHGSDSSGLYFDARVPSSKVDDVRRALAAAREAGEKNRAMLLELRERLDALIEAHPEARRG